MSDIVRVNFHGEEIVVHREGEEAWVPMRALCGSLGLSWGSQYNRIRRRPVLAEGVFILKTHDAIGREQETVMLNLRLLPGWLFGIETRSVKPELRDKLEQYQKRCFEVLYRAVFGLQEPPNMRRIEALLPDHTLRVLAALRAMADDDGVCRQAGGRIAVFTGLSWETVSRAQALVQELGLCHSEEPKRQKVRIPILSAYQWVPPEERDGGSGF